MFQSGELLHRSPLLDGQRKLVDTGIYPVIANNLRPIEAAIGGREGDLDVHLRGTGIIARM